MLQTETKIRVRYGETDQMGYVYYGNYPLYYEVARTDMIRKIGWTYSQMEKNGVMMPVASMNVKYLRPAYYDDELTVKVTVKKMPTKKMEFEYEVFNEQNKLINTGNTTLVFVDMKTGRPTNPPEEFTNKIKVYFE
ncbi:MAG: acyl-CoA thioesterase [Bacteroidales bacterium]|nr:acyl-CoA thioesterase [Bacteroidales bacterium]